MGCAVLAKGPVGVVLPTATIGLFLLYATLPELLERRRKGTSEPLTRRERARAWMTRQLRPFAVARIVNSALAMRPLLLIGVVLLVAAPWYVAVHVLTDGAFTKEFFWTHNFERASAAMEGHRGPIVYYPLAMLIGFFPWSIFAVPVLLSWFRRTGRSSPPRAAYVFAACWIAAYVVTFSIARTKLPNYVLPAYPALALLTAAYLRDWLRGVSVVAPVWNYAACAVLAGVGIGILIGAPLALPGFLPEVNALPLAAMGGVLLAGAAAWFALARRHRHWAVTSIGTMAVIFTTLVFSVALVEVDRRQPSEALVQAVREHGGDSASLAAFRHLEPSVVYYAGRQIREFSDAREVDEFFQSQPAPYLVTNADELPTLRYSLPDDVIEVARMPRFLKPGEVVVLGRESRVGTAHQKLNARY
jgi:4-amino-4-deoxy-L-arabinose transferase-like glycosyltransferase